MSGISTGVLLTSVLLQFGCIPDLRYFALLLYFESNSDSAGSKRNSITEATSLECETEHIVLPTHIDRNLHMNNSAYIYELNFTRKNLFNSLGLWKILKRNQANLIVQAQSIRYRRELKIWQKYRIISRILSWDDERQVFYVESRFLSYQDSFILAIHHVKYKIVQKSQTAKITPTQILDEAKLLVSPGKKPIRDNFIRLWEEANDFSSKELNPQPKKKQY